MSASYKIIDDNTITAVVPDYATDGPVLVDVTNAAGDSMSGAAAQYLFLPSVTGVSPASGPQSGGNSVTITGSGFSTMGTLGGEVFFGTTQATKFNVISDEKIVAELHQNLPAPLTSGSGIMISHLPFRSQPTSIPI